MVIIKQYFPFIAAHLIAPLFCLDIGAYKGTFGELVRDLYHGSKVIMYEPSPIAYKELIKNFPKETVYNHGISDNSHKEKFVIYADCPALNRVTGLKESLLGNDVIDVQFKSLDELYTLEIDVCKIDTEGEEFNVMKGAFNLLSNKKIKFLFFESGITYHQRGYDLKEVLSYLFESGYKTYAIRDKKLVRLDTDYNEHHVDDYMATYLEI